MYIMTVWWFGMVPLDVVSGFHEDLEIDIFASSQALDEYN